MTGPIFVVTMIARCTSKTSGKFGEEKGLLRSGPKGRRIHLELPKKVPSRERKRKHGMGLIGVLPLLGLMVES